MNWTVTMWILITAIVPVVAFVLYSYGKTVYFKLDKELRARIEWWVNVFVKTAQMIEPDPVKRKEWVIEQVLKVWPSIDKERLSALIEATLAELKLENGVDWAQLPPNVNPTTPPV